MEITEDLLLEYGFIKIFHNGIICFIKGEYVLVYQINVWANGAFWGNDLVISNTYINSEEELKRHYAETTGEILN